MPTARCNLCSQIVDAEANLHCSKDGYRIVRCPSCGLLFRFHLPGPTEVESIYGPEYFKRDAGSLGGQGYADYVADAPLHRAAAARRLELISRYVERGRLLDVGAAAGFFLAEAADRGWCASGVDVSRWMVEWGQANLGVDLVQATFDGANVTGPIDVVTMWDYLEHSTDPRGDLEHAAQLLRSQGVLALSTGNASSLVARATGSRWHLLTPRHHNFFFDVATLRRLLEATGFDLVWLGHPGGRYTLAYLAHKAQTMVESHTLRRLSHIMARSRIGTFAMPLNLFDIVTVVARRRS